MGIISGHRQRGQSPTNKTLFAFAAAFYVEGVIERYSRPKMRQIWSDERKFQIWLEIEVLACEAMAELGQIPKADAAEIRKRAASPFPRLPRSKNEQITMSLRFWKTWRNQ